MKKSKHSPKKLPDNQTGLYSILDPHQVIESNLINWYENLVIGTDQPPSDLLWGDIFTHRECFAFVDKIEQIWLDFEEEASLGFRTLYPLVEYDRWYRSQISRRIASFKSLVTIKTDMEDILLKRERLEEFKNRYGDKYITPGQPKQGLLNVLIQDIEILSDKYFGLKQNKTYRSALAFYLVKQDIFDLECAQKSKSEKCSMIDCISFKRKNCADTIKNYAKKVGLNIDSSKVLLCENDFNYSACKECRSNFIFLTSLDSPDLFLRTPCKVAIGRYNDILERIKRDKNTGKPKGMHVRDIRCFQEELKKARQDNCKKEITAIFDKAQKLYPNLTRKDIQRKLSQQ